MFTPQQQPPTAQPTTPPSPLISQQSPQPCGTTLISQLLTFPSPYLHACPQCSKSFKKKSKLDRHIRQYHLNITPFQCTLCPKAFKRIQHLQRHQSIHSQDKPVECFQCQRPFKNKEQMIRHFKLQHLKKVIKCQKCGECFLKKRTLKKHEKGGCGGEEGKGEGEKGKVERVGKKIKKESKKKIYICGYKDCEKPYESHYALRRHYRKMHRFEESPGAVVLSDLISDLSEGEEGNCEKEGGEEIQEGESYLEFLEGIQVEIVMGLEEESGEGESEIVYQEEEDGMLNC